MKRPQHSAVSGSALVTVLWLSGVLSLAIFGAVKFTQLQLQSVVDTKAGFEAENLAETALALASHPAVERVNPVLRLERNDGKTGYVGTIGSEEGFIPLNQFLVQGEKAVIDRLFQLWGLSSADSAAVVDALADWVDQDDLVSLHGAEADQYTVLGRPGFPWNRPFESFREVEWVRGMELVSAVKPDWEEYFTLWSSGTVDLNETGAEITAAVIGISDLERAESFVAHRKGEDGIRGTEDDIVFQTVPSVFDYFGSSYRQRRPLLGVNSSTNRITGFGWHYGSEVKISEVRRNGALLWRMQY